MFCSHCGKPVAEGAASCPYCGAPLRPEEATPRYARPLQETPPPAYGGAEPPVLRLLRRMARSPYFLVPAAGYTCMAVFGLMDGLLRNSLTALNRYLSIAVGNSYEMNRMLGYLYDLVPVVNSTSPGAVLISNLPAILIAAGIWMTFASAMDRSGAPIKTAGLTMIRVILIIKLVLCALMTVLMLVLLAVFVSTLWVYDDAGAAFVVFLALVVLVVGILALLLFYHVRLIVMVDGLRRTIRTGRPSGRIYVYVAVMSILGGVISLFSALSGGVIYALSNLAGAVSGIGLGVFLFRCRDELRSLSAPAQTGSAE